jgi:hypothetical protein
MNAGEKSEVQQILKLQTQIADRLNNIGFKANADTEGNIIHHLAEFAVMGQRLTQEDIPALLSLPPDQKERLGDLAVSIHSDLLELKEALIHMEPAFIELMNFLTSE